MSPKTPVGSEKCEKLHGVIFSRICLKRSRNCSAVFPFLGACDLKQNCKPNVSTVKKTSRDLGGEGAGALSIHNMKGEGGIFYGGPGAYLEGLKPILSYPPVIWKGIGRFPWRARSLSGRPETKCAMPTRNIPAIWKGREAFSMRDQVNILKT